IRSLPAIAYNGTNYLLGWVGQSSGEGGIRGARIKPNGTLLDSSSLAISSSLPVGVGGCCNTEHNSLAAASDGTSYVLAWSTGTSVLATRVSAMGTVLDASPITVSSDARTRYAPTATFDGMNYVLAWADYRSGNQALGQYIDNVYAARMTPNGTVLDT